ncbi:MAG: 4-hydroxy-3-methylbut-2-enyl diphosphate reductase [candidate division WOR-3 bacterium]|jgi:4-hydroxy-3-methylbut-2-enyl diphosphate reductase|nr:4-hydroxy-3-methylbut-2-enyl diphosphate reductase [candidate division WOR-3 bacterium]MDH7519161.1 4-hydroxy-3-methylbut-2-enyl diphosphate reductase [bacterium]
MPRVIVAKPTGFCFGVERAVTLAREGLKRFGKVYTFGQLVHNPQVLDELSRAGIKAVRKLDEVRDGALVIRAHGCPPEVFKECEKRGIEVIDATCPYVRRVQEVARRLAAEGYQVVVVGERNHPEVRAILAAAGEGAKVFSPRIKLAGRVGIVAQTTVGRERLKEAVANSLNFRYNEIRVFDTVCAEVVARQEAVLRLAKRVDAIVVVGGKNSANTRRLAEIARSTRKPVVHLTGASGLNLRRWGRFKVIGIVAGASTPARVVEEIARTVRNSGCDKQPSLRRSDSNE